MNKLKKFLFTPIISFFDIIVIVLASSMISDGNWIVALIVFVVGMFVSHSIEQKQTE